MTSSASEFARRDPEGLKLVELLPTLKGDVAGYRIAMREIGRHLASAMLSRFPIEPSGNICVVCTVEDADFLARGVIDTLEANGLAEKVRLICLWNESKKDNGISRAPIVKQYREEFDENRSAFIIVKSIISGACVVKTNLTRILSFAAPQAIYVAAPVMLEGAEDRLKKEFPPGISDGFKFVHYATHSEKIGDHVVPGIGGSVYELLGLTSSTAKTSYLPNIVKERRRKHFPAFA